MKIAVEGCAHGELEKIYDTIAYLEEQNNIKVDLLICCGDFQSTRNEADLRCMAVPQKYYNMCSFYKYYTGEAEAPLLTIFIGGNHEASNYLQELPYGGWVAPKIYYMGYAGVIQIGGVRIGGLSGIYKGRDYCKGHHEFAPYNDDSKRTVYHIRNLEVFRLKQLSQPIDIFISHDWPTNITNFGNKNQLLKFKPFFKNDIESGQLGSKPCEELLMNLKPEYWFSAHLHCRFAAIVPHEDEKTTKFLALDKCLPKRKFLQVIDVPHNPDLNLEISYDLEWLTILYLTNHLLSVTNSANYMPGPNGAERWDFKPTEEEKEHVLDRMENNLVVPDNFVKTVAGYDWKSTKRMKITQPIAQPNPQTIKLCKQLVIDDPLELILNISSKLDEVLKLSQVSSSEPVSDSELELSREDTKIISKLSLPCPLNDSANSTLTEETIEELQIGESTSIVNDSLGEQIIEKIQATIIEETPVRKTFKRRNVEIYGDGNSTI